MANGDKLPEPMLKLIRRNAWIAVAAFLIVLVLLNLWILILPPSASDAGWYRSSATTVCFACHSP